MPSEITPSSLLNWGRVSSPLEIPPVNIYLTIGILLFDSNFKILSQLSYLQMGIIVLNLVIRGPKQGLAAVCHPENALGTLCACVDVEEGSRLRGWEEREGLWYPMPEDRCRICEPDRGCGETRLL